ncbi:DUF2787 family protein [Vibrio cholerae]|nr:DUF2787 domain-containing protein [Vibrio cholerae]ELJ8684817.1 DUF2787 family protein [Vibrio cholerae]HDZ9324696.1 DUF2787 family protein [Vibrio cholerae]
MTNHGTIVFIASFSYQNNGLDSLDHELYSDQVNRWCYPLDTVTLRGSEQTSAANTALVQIARR